MTKNEVNTSLEEFCRKYLSPSQDERDRISKRFKELQDILPGNEIFQSGSFGRETTVSPVHDLDVIWVLPESEYILGSEMLLKENSEVIHFDVEKPLESLAKMLESEYKRLNIGVVIDHSQTHSVNISFKDKENFSIDVVPAIKSGITNTYGEDIYLVPEIQKLGHKKRTEIYKTREGNLEWILSDPKGYLKQSLSLNINPSYRKAVKFARVWKTSCNAGLTKFELKSFHIELVVAGLFIQDRNLDFYDAVTLFLTNAATWLARPSIPDLADGSVFVDDYLNEDVDTSQRLFAVKFASKSLKKFQEMLLKGATDEIYSSLRESIISTPPWPFAPDCKWVNITCEIERKSKLRNSSNPKNFRNNLPGDVLQDINGPKQMQSGEYVGREYFLTFTPFLDGLNYDEIRWLVVNNGIPALKMARIGGWRGNEFYTSNIGSNYREEHTLYPGMHRTECYIIKNGVCIGFGKFDVGIEGGEN